MEKGEETYWLVKLKSPRCRPCLPVRSDPSARRMPLETHLYPPLHSSSLSSGFIFTQTFNPDGPAWKPAFYPLINQDERKLLHPQSSNKSFQQVPGLFLIGPSLAYRITWPDLGQVPQSLCTHTYMKEVWGKGAALSERWLCNFHKGEAQRRCSERGEGFRSWG